MSTNLSNKEWYALHGYDEYGRPKQRYVWEGTCKGPPKRRGHRSGWIWLVDYEKAASLVVAMRLFDGKWVADGIFGPLDQEQNTFVADASTPYEEVIKKAYAMYLLGVRHGKN